MKLEIKALQPEERLYVYSQSQQLRAQTGSIGHLRGDFGKSGCEFFCTWEDHIKSYRLDTFGDEFDRFINALRFDTVNDRPFAGRNALRLYCKAHPESGFKGNYSEEYGFRVDKGQYSFLLRCNPMVGDYNFYVFCYIKKLLDSHMERARKGIRFVTAFGKEIFRLPDGEKIQITRPDGEKVLRSCRYIDEMHVEIGGGWDNLYHIDQFAELMEQCGKKVAPVCQVSGRYNESFSATEERGKG